MANQFQMTMRMTQFFLDRQEVTKRIGKANRRAMSKVGAYVRRRARSSLRRRKRPSEPGQPPSVHSRNKVATLKNILFAYDPGNETLVVGPVRLNLSKVLGPQLGTATVPQVLEFGETVKVREVRVGKSWRSGMRRVRSGQPVRVRSAKYAPRPFMGPALEDEVASGTIPDAWSGSVKG
jgi:hypothetical protein